MSVFKVLFISVVVLVAWRDVGAQSLDMKDLTSSVTRFSHKMYQSLAGNRPSAIFSPFSAHAALSMACLGARDSTADQMEAVLGLTNVTNPHLDYQNIIKQINASPNVKVLTANGIWLNSMYKINQDYQDEVARLYFAEVDNINLNAVGGPEAPINNWVANKTENKIQSILQPGSISPSTALVLVNSLFFNGTWASQFKAAQTQKGPFYRVDGRTVQVDFMDQIQRYDLKKNYIGNDIIRIPFRSRRFAFYVALSKTAASLSALERALNDENSEEDALFHGLQETVVKLTLPKFSVAATMNLKDVLIEMGMPEAFSSAANFSGITPSSVFITRVIQKAMIEVQESGTVAAAATAIMIGRTSSNILPPNPYVFRVNRPFLFFIRDDILKLILFQGKCSDPTVKNIVI